MIPVKLTIKGLYSYKETTEIDFGRLTEGRLFGIFGAVGSGKSALLEAITYALFGETERLNSRENRGYNMMNLKSSELWIDFEFKIGATAADRYRFTVSQKRNSKRFQDVGAPKRIAYSFKDDEWHPMSHTDAGQVLGLNYEHFIKTIIIPQGKFQDFLAMGATDRSKMLKEIFELHRFDLSAKTKHLIDSNEKRLQTVRGQLQELQQVDADQIQAREAELTQLESSLQDATKAKAALDTDLKLFDLLKNLVDEIEAIREILDPMEEEVPEFDERALALRRYEEAQARFQDLFTAKTHQIQALKGYEAEQIGLKEQLDRLQTEAQSLAENYQLARAAFESRDQYRVEAQDWRLMAELQQVLSEIHKLEARVQNGHEHVVQEQANVEQLRAGLQTLTASVAALKSALPDIHQLHACNNWHQELNRLKLAADKAQIEAQGAEAALMQADEAIVRILEPAGDPETTQAALQERRTQVQVRLAQLNAHVRLTDFAAELQEGQPCPLCGALSHPQPMDPGNVSDERAAAEKAAAQIEADLKVTADRIQALATARVRQEERRAAHTRAQAAHTHALAQVEAHAASFQWKVEWREEPQVVATELTEAQAQAQEFEVQQNALEQARKQLETAEATRQRYERELSKLELQLAELKAKQQALATQIQVLDPAAYADVDAESCLVNASKAETRFHQIGKDHFIAEERQKTHAASLRQAEMALERVQTQAEAAAQGLQRTEANIKERLAASSFTDEAEVAMTLAQSLNISAEREEIEHFKAMLSEQRHLLRSQQVLLGDQRYDAETHREKRNAHSILIEQIQEASVEKGRLVEQLERVKADQRRREVLDEQAALLDDRKADLDVLAKLFKANGFVDYVSSVYLKELCDAANTRFTTLTRNRLRLEVSSDNSFEVRDMVNGGELRSVKTLSGGQTFQAALSLALALADSIQQRNRSAYNFFFLDEGFGSLDRESLQIVFDTLKNLQKEDRVVGVISHVEELQQEIGSYLSIRQDDERGSLVTPSWRT
jgi:exonuclease SbcC